MKKLRLKALSLGAKEILTRDQQRSISGGCVSDEQCLPGWTCNVVGFCVTEPAPPGSGTGSTGTIYGGSDGDMGCGDGMSGCWCPGGFPGAQGAYLGCFTEDQCNTAVLSC